jgi:hypothetical protein
MSRTSAAWNANNYSSPNTAYTFGPYTVAVSTGKILRVESSISFGAAGGGVTTSGVLGIPVMWGVEWVPHNGSPLLLPADYGSEAFFFSGNASGDTWSNATWAPSTDTAGNLGYGAAKNSWRGQQYAGEQVDYYVVYSATVSGFANLSATHSTQVWFTY